MGKIIFIAGASDGLGFATSKILLEKGYKIIETPKQAEISEIIINRK
jgi:NADP-dependent 3-hydroxy acid dehydrogenase YdfG